MNKIKSMIKYLFLFAFGGVVYNVIELLYRGHTHWTMFILGGLCFVSGLIMEYLSFSPTAVTVIFMFGALFAGYEIAVLAFKSLINKHTVGPAMLVTIACIASFIIGHPEEGAAVTFLYFIAEFLEDYAEHRAKRSIKSA